MRYSIAYTSRHNRMLDRLKTATAQRFTVTHENRPVGDTILRPDLALARGETAIVVDVTCPFDNREAFNAARASEVAKYEPIGKYLLRKFLRVSIEAVIVGAVGSSDPYNDKVTRRLCSKGYMRFFKKLPVNDTIAAYREVYSAHVRATWARTSA